jgi:multidrug efflux pump subunit AcrA (membrane-fusion protein)
MFASGVLILDAAEDAIGIPVAALREDDEGQYVLKVEGDQVVRQPVEVARTWDGGQVYQVTSGLAAGDVIVASALERLDPGTTITVIGN